MNDKEETEKKEGQSAKEIAEIMVENMKANMENPDFLHEKELRLDEARNEVIKERIEREKNQE
jgi:hypothetical protein